MYQAAVGAWGLSPSEFWGLTYAEFWALWRFHRDQDLRSRGLLTPEEERELREWVTQDDAT